MPVYRVPRMNDGVGFSPVLECPQSHLTWFAGPHKCHQYFPVFKVKDNRSRTYWPAAIGEYLAGLSSLIQEGSVSTISS